MKTHRFLPIFLSVAQSVRTHIGTWLLIGWFTICSIGIPIPSGFAANLDEDVPAEVETEDGNHSVKLRLELEPQKAVGGCCSAKPQPTSHQCSCSIKKKQSGTCCCSKTTLNVAQSCCSNKAPASDQPPPNRTQNDDGDHDRIISVCGCAQEVGGFLFFSQPFEIGEYSTGLQPPNTSDSLISPAVLFESHHLIPESPPPEVV